MRRRETEPTSSRCDRYRRHSRRDGAGGYGAPGTESPLSRFGRRRATSPPPHAVLQPGSRVEASAPKAPSPTARLFCAPPGRGAGVPSGRHGAGRQREPPASPRSPSRRRGWSRPLVLTRLLFPARVDRSRLRLPSAVSTRPRPGARDRGRPEQAVGPAESRAAREQRPPRAGEKLRLSRPGRPEKSSRGEPCAGTPRAQWSQLTWRGPWRVRITECPASALFA